MQTITEENKHVQGHKFCVMLCRRMLYDNVGEGDNDDNSDGGGGGMFKEYACVRACVAR